MLNAVITWSLQHRGWVVLGWLAVAVAGALAFARLPLDAFPDTTPVQVQVNVTAPSLAPLEIERQLTFPVEQALSGLPGLSEVRSVSRFGYAQITVTFEDGTALDRARQAVNERLLTVEVPPGVARPSLGPLSTGLGEVFHYLVSGDGVSLAELRSAHDWIIQPQLRSVPGVAEINAWGGDERRVEVRVDPARLHTYDLAVDDVVAAIEQNVGSTGGGSIDQAGESTLVRGLALLGQLRDVEDIVVTTRAGVPVRVADVARVVDGRALRRGAATAHGQGEVVLGLGFLLIGQNSHDVTSRLAARLVEVERSLPAGVTVRPVYERTALVDRVLETVRTNLVEGAILVVVVLFLFLGTLRAGLVVASAIPLSLLFAFVLMSPAGVAGSLMSLGAIDFGLIVDSSVIMIENCMRRLRLEPQRPRLEVVREAALEVRRPTMFGELIILIVYLPILALVGIEGKLFRPMALTVVFALFGSMLLSLTLMPVLASLLLPKHLDHDEGRLMGLLQRAYRPVLRGSLARPGLVLSVALVVAANATLLATQLGSEFVPRLREGSIVINTVRLAGVSLDESVRYGTHIERALLAAFPDEIDEVWTRSGTAEVTTDPMGVELSDVFITLKPSEAWTRAESQDELVTAMQASLEGLPGMRMVFTQPIEMRMNEMIAGIRADVGVKLFGDSFDVLRDKAREIDRVVAGIPGATDLYTEQLTGQPVLEVEVDRAALARYGMTAREVLESVEALAGVEVAELREGERRFPLAVRIDEAYQQDPAALGRLLISNTKGERVPLARVATLRLVEGPTAIQREWGQRRIVVQANVRGRDVGSFVAEAQREIAARVELPPGYYVRFGGQFEHLADAQARLAVVVPVALILIFILLYVTYGRPLDAARVFTGVPFAMMGGVFALWLRDIPFSVSAGVGFVALSGVAVLGDMVLVSTIRQLLDEGRELRAAVVEAAERRLRPVLMTALVASLGFVPMALNTGLGAEVQRPLATVVIGGVISSTVLTLVVLPVLYTVLRRRS
jgi:cobalt-zinc-cadmium resistance protein CzcA